MGAMNSWRITQDFEMWMKQIEKRLMHEERRPSVTSASDLMGPGLGPYAVLINDWNDEAAVFNGIFYTEPGAFNAPDAPAGASAFHWMGQAYGNEDGWGYQRVTKYRVSPPETPGGWDEFRRRFYPIGELRAYGAWEAV